MGYTFRFFRREVWMSWKASSVMEERLRFVARLLDGEAMTDVCREFGVSRKTGLIYPFHDRELLVTACGRLCLHRKRINVSTVLAGQKLGIKEVDDGIWLASFMHYDLGYFDLEQKTLQPLDNPFGTRLSPMS
jgi:hypothetical protein